MRSWWSASLGDPAPRRTLGEVVRAKHDAQVPPGSHRPGVAFGGPVDAEPQGLTVRASRPLMGRTYRRGWSPRPVAGGRCRITRIVDRSDGRWVETKGDANGDVDPSIVPASAVVGRVALQL